jgi:hypothetical protein
MLQDKRSLITKVLSHVGFQFSNVKSFRIDNNKTILVVDNELVNLIETMRFKSFENKGENNDYGDSFAKLVDNVEFQIRDAKKILSEMV